MVGSANYYDDTIHGQYNVVTGERQPGSSFKPYVYLTAFRDHRLTMGSMLDDTSSHFANGQFHDFDNQDMGWITAHAALLLSRNVPALEAMQKAGISNVIDVAHSFGIHSTLKQEVGTAIGSSSISMLDQVTGYGVFATGGWLHPPIAVLSITDRSGNNLGQPSAPQAQQVASAQETYLIDYILKDYPRQWDLGWNKPFAGKSGTTNNFRDAWMMAYAPNLVIGTWMGHTGPGNQDMDGVYGSMVGSSVLKDFINNGLSQANYAVESFTRPSGLMQGGACAGPNGQSRSTSSVTVFHGPELYLPGTQDLCPTPSAAPTASPSHSASPTPSPSVVPSVLPSILPTPGNGSPSPSPSGGAPAPGGSAAPAPGG
jgi:membrane peptidoglycan carboxypeptidase